MDSPSKKYETFRDIRTMVRTVLKGTYALRKAGYEYLPKYPNEAEQQYRIRLNGAVLINYLSQTIESLVGRPFAKPVQVDKGANQKIQDFCLDVNALGMSIHRFAYSMFKESWISGFSGLLIEPYKESFFWKLFPAENILDISFSIEGISYVKLADTNENSIPIIREIWPDKWATWQLQDSKKWEIMDQGPNTLGTVPFIFHSIYNVQDIEITTPLLDLAYLNLAHWESKADQVNALRVARFPILAVSGITDTSNIVIGPSRWLSTPDPQGRWYYVESSGAAIGLGQKDLEDLEAKMASYGAQFLKKRPGNEAVTNRVLDTSESLSFLEACIQVFQDTLNLALFSTGQWMGLSELENEKSRLEINTNFDVNWTTAMDADVLLKLRAQKDISRLALIKEFQRRGIISDTYDAELDEEILSAEMPALSIPGLGA